MNIYVYIYIYDLCVGYLYRRTYTHGHVKSTAAWSAHAIAHTCSGRRCSHMHAHTYLSPKYMYICIHIYTHTHTHADTQIYIRPACGYLRRET